MIKKTLYNDTRYEVSPTEDSGHTVFWLLTYSRLSSKGSIDYENECVWADLPWGGFNLIGLYDD